VFTRVFFTALSWTEEITCFLLVAASLVGTAVGFKRGSHIAITFVTERLPGRGRMFFAVLVHLLGMAFFAVMATYGVLLMRTEARQISPPLRSPWCGSMPPSDRRGSRYTAPGGGHRRNLAEGLSMGWLLFGSFFVLLLLGVPVGLAVGLSALLIFLISGIPLQMVPRPSSREPAPTLSRTPSGFPAARATPPARSFPPARWCVASRHLSAACSRR